MNAITAMVNATTHLERHAFVEIKPRRGQLVHQWTAVAGIDQMHCPDTFPEP